MEGTPYVRTSDNGSLEDRETAIRAMEQCGLNNLQPLLQANNSDEIVAWCDWWMRQPNRPGKALLARRIASGEPAPAPEPRRDLMAEQNAYADSIVAWLQRNFPEFDRPRWGPHPAAVAAVIRLHHKHGKGRLTRREHGPEIRAAVKAWEQEETT